MVSKSIDYADEFDYPIFMIFTKKELKEILRKLLTDYDLDDKIEIWFGSNESVEISVDKMINDLTKESSKITKEQFDFLRKNLSNIPSIDYFVYFEFN